MNLDICIPFNHNFKAMEAVIGGLLRHTGLKAVRELLLHVQCPEETGRLLDICAPFPVRVVSVGTGEKQPLSVYMDRLFAACNGDWVVMTEQDVLPEVDYLRVAERLAADGFVVGAPTDTMHYDNINARGRVLYGQFGRLCPEPGYYHSALMFMDRKAVAAKSPTPFKLPESFKFMGQGVLGGEHYYGLRVNLAGRTDDLPHFDSGEDRTKLAFFRQLHSDYGYAADILFDGQKLATHIYHSSGYRYPFFSEAEWDWVMIEETRLLRDYLNHNYKLKAN